MRTPHGFNTIPPNPLLGICKLKRETRVGNVLKHFSGCIGITNRVIDGRVGRRGNDAKDHALIFLRRQFLRRYLRNCEKHQTREQRNPGPNNVNSRARLQRAIEMVPIPIAETIECAINPAFEAVLDVMRRQQICRHHRRKDERDDTGNENCARQGERKFAEERAG